MLSLLWSACPGVGLLGCVDAYSWRMYGEGREVAYPKLKFMKKPYGSPLVYKLIKNVTLNEGVVMEFSCIGITRCRLSNKNLSDRHWLPPVSYWLRMCYTHNNTGYCCYCWLPTRTALTAEATTHLHCSLGLTHSHPPLATFHGAGRCYAGVGQRVVMSINGYSGLAPVCYNTDLPEANVPPDTVVAWLLCWR